MCSDSSPDILDNIITENISGSGGGISCWGDSSPNIVNNIISKNNALWGGALLCYEGTSPNLLNNVLYMNTATQRGGGVYCQGASPIIRNNTILSNWSQFGGGIYFKESSTHAVNTILWGNSASTGPEIWIGTAYKPSSSTIDHSNVMGSQTSVHVEPNSTFEWGQGMIDADPLFVHYAEEDFHLTYPSPCKDAGDSSAPGLPTEDFEGDPRIAQGAVDLGADEFYTHLYVTGDKTPGGTVQGKFVGMPGTTPVGLFIGSNILPSPMNTLWGEFWLQAPWFLFTLIPIPGPGILELPTRLTGTLPAPYDIPMQALIGLNAGSLTNLCVLEVR